MKENIVVISIVFSVVIAMVIIGIRASEKIRNQKLQEHQLRILELRQQGTLECQRIAATKTDERWGYKSCIEEVQKVYEEGKKVKLL